MLWVCVIPFGVRKMSFSHKHLYNLLLVKIFDHQLPFMYSAGCLYISRPVYIQAELNIFLHCRIRCESRNNFIKVWRKHWSIFKWKVKASLCIFLTRPLTGAGNKSLMEIIPLMKAPPYTFSFYNFFFFFFWHRPFFSPDFVKHVSRQDDQLAEE